MRREEDWDSLFRRFQMPVYVFVMELVGDRQVALELVQDTFLNATRYIASLKSDDAFDSWLFSIARQKVQQHWRRSGRARELLENLGEPPEVDASHSPDDRLISEEEREAFLEKLDDLPESLKGVLLLHYLEDFSVTEISGILEVPEGTVKSRLHHARKRLRAQFQSLPST